MDSRTKDVIRELLLSYSVISTRAGVSNINVETFIGLIEDKLEHERPNTAS